MALINSRAEERNARSGLRVAPGTYLGVVMENADSNYSGRLSVWVAQFGGDSVDKTTWKIVSYASPFYGVTPFASNTGIINGSGGSEDPAATNLGDQGANAAADGATGGKKEDIKSYGMWVQPPMIGTKVLVTFVEGDDQRGFWFAAVPELSHGMIPAIAKGQSGKPEVEFDPSKRENVIQEDIRKVKRDEYKDEVKKFEAQGLQDDENRGYISSSSFRESPSKVMGFNTPGGHTLVMDDGDEDDKSKLIRIRTAAGNQITMNDDTGMIYVINSQGTGWLELSPSGHLDVYAEAGINLATKKDINLHADNDINIHAGGNLKMVAMKGAKLQGTEELQLHGKKTMIEGKDSLQMHSCEEIIITSFKDIYMKAFQNFVLQGKCWRWNSGNAKEAEQVPPEKPTKVSDYDTTVKRAPNHEPYKEHDNGSGGGAGAGGGMPGMPSGMPDIGGMIPGIGGAGGGGAGGGMPNIGGIIPGIGGAPGTSIMSKGANATSLLANATKVVSGANPVVSGGGGTKAASSLPATSVTGGLGPLISSPTLPTSSVGNNPMGSFSGGDTLGQAQQLASQALNGISDTPPASNIPAGTGGGAAGFATGDNCERPSGFGGGGGSGGAMGGQKNFVPPDSLKNDPEFQAEMAKIKADHPGLTDQQIYNVIGGESGFNFAAVNGNSGATGAFQFTPSTAASLGYSTAQIQAMTPAQQLGVYNQYLTKNNYNGGPLGIMQAAPAFAGRSGSTIVYPQGSKAWQQNPGWRGSNGQITVDSINSYYGY